MSVDESLVSLGGVGSDGGGQRHERAGTVQAQFNPAFGGRRGGQHRLQPGADRQQRGERPVCGRSGAANGQGAAIVLNQVGNVITGSAGGVDYFTLTINPTTGK